MVTHTQLLEHLNYDPTTGVFTWIKRPPHANSVKINTEAGALTSKAREVRYKTISLLGVRHGAHQWAWFYMTGSWPTKHIDHIDGNGLNNAFSNLRECEAYENHQNRKEEFNKHGYTGVALINGRYNARITYRGKLISLGYYATPEEAHAAYLKGKQKYHTFQPTLRNGG